MGFFSNIHPGITQEVNSSKNTYKHEYSKDVDIIGLFNQRKKARSYIDRCHIWKRPRLIVIKGDKCSGKSSLAKAIMQDNEMKYTRVFLDSIQNGEKPLVLLSQLVPQSGGLILENIDKVTDQSLINALNKMFTSKGVVFGREKIVDLRKVTIIIPIHNSVKLSMNLNRACVIPVEYTKNDYSMLYLRFCSDAGYTGSRNKIIIDSNLISYIGKYFKDNIKLFRKWVYALMTYGEKNGETKIDKSNIHEFFDLDLDVIPDCETED